MQVMQVMQVMQDRSSLQGIVRGPTAAPLKLLLSHMTYQAGMSADTGKPFQRNVAEGSWRCFGATDGGFHEQQPCDRRKTGQQSVSHNEA